MPFISGDLFIELPRIDMYWTNTHLILTRGKTRSLKPKVFIMQSSIILPESRNCNEAHPILKWEHAITNEYQALMDNNT